jgi:hypothetical protein
MIRLFAHPYPSIPSVSSTGDTHRNTEKERQLADKRGGEGVGEEPNHTIAKKTVPLKIIQYSLIHRKYTVNKTKDVFQF